MAHIPQLFSTGGNFRESVFEGYNSKKQMQQDGNKSC